MVLRDKMFSVECEEGSKTKIQLHPDYLIYQAHFPGNPITPGVCIVQIIGELAESRVGRQLSLHKVVNLKFLAPLSPVETPFADVIFTAIEDEDDTVRTKGMIMAGDRTMTKFTIIYCNK